jgi:hypothetical protein
MARLKSLSPNTSAVFFNFENLWFKFEQQIIFVFGGSDFLLLNKILN